MRPKTRPRIDLAIGEPQQLVIFAVRFIANACWLADIKR